MQEGRESLSPEHAERIRPGKEAVVLGRPSKMQSSNQRVQ